MSDTAGQPGESDIPPGADASADWSPVARRRLGAVATSGFLLAFSYVAADVVFPLWATSDLGFTAATWAQLRALRFAGVLLGVILLGALSDRFGQRRSAVWALLVSGVVTSLFWFNSRLVLRLLMPLFGALVAGPCSVLLVAPSIMWVSRVAGGATQVAAFAVHKVVSALYLSLAMCIFGLLESWVGIRCVLLIGGLIMGWHVPHKYPRSFPGFGQAGWLTWRRGRVTALRADEDARFSLYPLRVKGRKLIVSWANPYKT